MSVQRPRTKLINFRLSQDEFDSLKAACSVLRERSISDFARGAVLRSIEAQLPGDGHIQHKLSSLDEKVGELDSMLRRLTSALELAQPAAVGQACAAD